MEQVASREAWDKDPLLVWRFYSMRRREALEAKPNQAHLALAALEKQIGDRFRLCTQNVDDLHERAGSRRIRHMHGSLFASRCVGCQHVFADCALYLEAAELPGCALCGAAVRPHIVWFGEMPFDLDGIEDELTRSTIFLVVGTSGSVYPAAGFAYAAARHGIRTIYVGPDVPLNADAFDDVVLDTAVKALPGLFAR